jgi:hypothetical protein
VLFWFVGLFAMSGWQTPEPRPDLGRTYYVYVAMRLGGHGGYVKPWVGQTYDFVWTAMEVLTGVVILAVIVLVVARRINGESSWGSGEPGAV